MISTNVLEKFKLKRQCLLIRTDLWKHKKKEKRAWKREMKKGLPKRKKEMIKVSGKKNPGKEKRKKGKDKSLRKKEPC